MSGPGNLSVYCAAAGVVRFEDVVCTINTREKYREREIDSRKKDKRIREQNAERSTPSLACIFASKDRDERVLGTGPERSQQQLRTDMWAKGPKLRRTVSSDHRTVC